MSSSGVSPLWTMMEAWRDALCRRGDPMAIPFVVPGAERRGRVRPGHDRAWPSRLVCLLWLAAAAPTTSAHAHHGQDFFATATADTVPPKHDVVAIQGAYFRPKLDKSTGQRIELAPMFLRGVSEELQLEAHLHWLTNPARRLDSGAGVFEGFAIGGRHRLPDLGSEPGEFPFSLAVAAQMDIPTAHAMKTLGAGPGGLFHLILSRTSSNGITFAANLSSSVFTHLECVEASPVMAEAPRRQHAHLEAVTCASREPQGEFEWGFALGIRKTMSGNLSAGAELAREVEYPPGMATIVGFYWTPEPEWLVRWGVAFPTGFEEDVISLRVGAALSF